MSDDAFETARLNALRQLRLLDTSPSESFDRITRMASRIFDLPIAAVSLTDLDRQWFKSKVGVEHDSIPRQGAPCAGVCELQEVLVIEDFSRHPDYADTHLARQGIQFYAGAPLVTPDGHGLGALCVLGTEPRSATDAEIAALKDLAAIVMAQIEMQNAIGRVDPTSGLPNRTQFLEDLTDMARQNPGEPRVAVVLELAGAECLRDIARVMGPTHLDQVVRLAALELPPLVGPECQAYLVAASTFAFLAPPAVDLADYLTQLETVRADLCSREELRLPATSILGVAPFVLGQTSADDVLRALHSALQDAREAGTSLGVYSPLLDARHQRRFTLLAEFPKALSANDQLRLVYQPRIDLRSGRCIGVEALARWQHPDLGSVSPGEFVPLVEHSAHVGTMTAWVLDAALARLVAWRGAGLDLMMSLNISAANLDDADFVRDVERALARHGVDPSHIELEVTESAVMRNAAQAVERLKALAAAGIATAIDDFGTGYSSLAYLQKLPASVVKIDQAFVRTLGEDTREIRLVRSMVALAKDLGFRVVAEGVETEAARQELLAMGCDEAQGYLIARPLTPEDFLAWLPASDAHRVAAA